MVNGWEREMLKFYAKGNGIDMGCGKFKIGAFGLDKDKTVKPDLVSELDNVNLPENSLDYIVSSHAIEHARSTLDALREWHRLLKKGGVLALTVPDGDLVGGNLGDSAGQHTQLFYKDSLDKFLKFTSFKVLEICKMGGILFALAQK